MYYYYIIVSSSIPTVNDKPNDKIPYMKRMHDDYSNPTIKRKSITDSRIHQSPPEIIPEITPKQISPIQQITS